MKQRLVTIHDCKVDWNGQVKRSRRSKRLMQHSWSRRRSSGNDERSRKGRGGRIGNDDKRLVGTGNRHAPLA
jgi:hypothetical protein